MGKFIRKMFILLPGLIWMSWIRWWFYVNIFFFRTETPSFRKVGPKNQNCHFRLKFHTFTNLNMLDLIMMFIFSTLSQKYLSRAIFFSKFKIYLFQLKYDTHNKFEYTEFDDVHFWCFRPKIYFFRQL